ncbi:MAG: sel1 repeat family protein [Candidatus Tectomicrobia bacterium]|nr:sel1 repeat family protein [Candidatus Tectomicrobia bacterium]
MLARRLSLLPLAFLLAGAAPAPPGFKEGVAAFRAGDYPAALREFKALGEKGLAEAQFNVGLMHRQGLGVKVDLAEARRWYRKAADQGHAKAQLNLGTLYARGLGVKEDAAEAFKWHKRAAEQGLAQAQRLVGEAYVRGEGTKRDLVLAHAWLSLANRGGEPEAGALLREVAARLSPGDLWEAQRLAGSWEPKRPGGLLIAP